MTSAHVSLFASERYLPAKGSIPLTSEHKLTYELIDLLRAVSAGAINKAAGGPVRLTADDIAVVPLQLHPWSMGSADLWVIIETDALGSDPDKHEMVMSDLRDILESDETEGPTPSYTVVCRPLAGSGVTVNRAGEVTQTWGTSEAFRSNH